MWHTIKRSGFSTLVKKFVNILTCMNNFLLHAYCGAQIYTAFGESCTKQFFNSQRDRN